MATVHPSRMGLIPQEMRGSQGDRTRGRSSSPRRSRRSPSPRRDGSRERERDRDRDRGRDDESRGRGRDEIRDRDRGHDSYRPSEPRRASPKYDDYRRAPPPAVETGGEPSAPWRQPENMYPARRDHHGGPTYGGSGNAGNAGFMESRRAQRAAQTVNVWPSSPKAPARPLSPKGKRSSKKSKRDRSESSSDSDSEEEKRRREKKERKRARRQEKEERKEKRRHHHKSRHSDEESDDGHRHHKYHSERRSRTRSKSKSVAIRSPSRGPTPDRMDEDRVTLKRPHSPTSSDGRAHSRQMSAGAPPSSRGQGDSEDDDEVGPQPLQRKGGTKKFDERAYGGALLRGEGSAMAAFLQDGTESRIPRRGEIGLTSDEIAKYEDVGYVMSGSRHRRMNAVRMRKENQVISAEEKRGILKLQREERERKEMILRDEFSQLVDERLKGSGAPGT